MHVSTRIHRRWICLHRYLKPFHDNGQHQHVRVFSNVKYSKKPGVGLRFVRFVNLRIVAYRKLFCVTSLVMFVSYKPFNLQDWLTDWLSTRVTLLECFRRTLYSVCNL